MSSWNTTDPIDTETEKLGDDRIRDVAQFLQEALAIEGIFPGPDPNNNPVFWSAILYGTTAQRPAAVVAYAGRWYYNTDTQTIQQQNSSLAWVSITAPANIIPSGSNMIWYQASAPTGWNQLLDAALDDRTFRIVSGLGGGSGGSDSIKTPPSHSHGGVSQSGTMPHTHPTTSILFVGFTGASSNNLVSYSSTAATITDSSDAAHTHPITAATGWSPAYIDAIVCTKL